MAASDTSPSTAIDPRYPVVREVPFLSRTGRFILIASFFCFLLVPLAGYVTGHVDKSEFEFRAKAQVPSIPTTLAGLAAYPGKLDAYVSDSFLMRGTLLTLSSRARYAVGGTHTDRVIVGRNGWLFWADDARHSRAPISADHPVLATWLTVMEARRRWLAARGIGFVVLLGPNKQTIYPERMPREWVLPTKSDVDQLLSYLRKHQSRVDFVDTRALLLSKKSDALLYHPYDTHWNARGGFVAYQAVAPFIKAHYPGFMPVTPEQIVWKAGPEERNMLRMMGLADYDDHRYEAATFQPSKVIQSRTERNVFNNGIWETYIVESSVPGPRVLALRDSFMNALQPFFAQSTSTFVSFPHKGSEFPEELIERLRPDMVIWEIIESGVLASGVVPKTPPLEPAPGSASQK